MGIVKTVSNYFKTPEIVIPDTTPKSKKKSFSASNNGCINVFNPNSKNFSGSTAAKLIDMNKNWVYAAQNKNAVTVASVLLRLYAVTDSINGQKKPRVPHQEVTNKELRRLSKQTYLKSNPLLDSNLSIQQIFRHPAIELLDSKNRQQFFYLIESYLELTGNAYVLIKSDRFGVPEDLMIVPSQLVTPKLEKGILQYFVNGPNGTQIPLPKDDVIHFKFPNPQNPLIGLAPLVSVVDSEELYQSMQLYEFALNSNSAVPAMVVKYLDGSLEKENVKKIEADWNRALRGIAKTGKIKAVGKNIEIKNIGLAPKEMNYLKGKKWIREEIAAAFGVPLSLLTTDDVNLANAATGFVTYKEFTIIPRLQLIENTLNSELISRYESSDRLFFAHDVILVEDKEFKLKEVTELFKAELLDRDEARASYGLEVE